MPLIFKTPKLNDFLIATKKSRTKPTIGDAVRGLGLAWTCGSKGAYYGAVVRDRNDDFVYVYHAEKVRDRWGLAVVEYFKSGPKKGQVKNVTKSKLVEGGWTLRVFKIPADRVKKVKQFERHFVVELAK